MLDIRKRGVVIKNPKVIIALKYIRQNITAAAVLIKYLNVRVSIRSGTCFLRLSKIRIRENTTNKITATAGKKPRVNPSRSFL